jgi:hypothetical protein
VYNIFIFSNYNYSYLFIKFQCVFFCYATASHNFLCFFMVTVVLNNNKDKCIYTWKKCCFLYSGRIFFFFSLLVLFFHFLCLQSFFKHIKIHYSSFSHIHSTFFSFFLPQFYILFVCMYIKQKTKNQFSIFFHYLFCFISLQTRKKSKRENRHITGSLREVLGWEFDSLCWCTWVKKKKERNINIERDMYSSRRSGPVTDLHNAHTVSTLMRTMTTSALSSHHPHRHSSRSKANLNGTLPFRSSSIHQVRKKTWKILFNLFFHFHLFV